VTPSPRDRGILGPAVRFVFALLGVVAGYQVADRLRVTFDTNPIVSVRGIFSSSTYRLASQPLHGETFAFSSSTSRPL